MRSMSHLQLNLGCSDTALASCLHPQLELSNIFASLFRTCSFRVPTLIFHASSIFFGVCHPLTNTHRGGDTKVKRRNFFFFPRQTRQIQQVGWVAYTKLQVVNISSGFPAGHLQRGKSACNCKHTCVHTHTHGGEYYPYRGNKSGNSQGRKWNDKTSPTLLPPSTLTVMRR